MSEIKEEVEKTEKAKESIEETKAEIKEEIKEDDLFRLNNNKLETNIVVKGSIDLASINEKTRPARKSRAQRKKERLEREDKVVSSQKVKEENIKALKKETLNEKKAPGVEETDDNSKKKRKRIRKGKVNVEKTGTTTTPTTTFRKKPILRKPVKAEVSEEDVQKQIKETLARLTQKKGGGKGGAKHRRDKRDAVVQRQKAEVKEQERESRILQLTEFVTANDLINMYEYRRYGCYKPKT